MARRVQVASLADIPADGGLRIEVSGRAIGLFRVGDAIRAVDDTCTHAEASLCEGMVDGEEITCPWHFATFNLSTGECTGPPAEERLASYPVTIEGDAVHIDLP